MSKLSFIKYFLVLIFLFQCASLYAQSWEEKWREYQKGQFIPTDSLLKEELANENPYYLTLLALSYSDAEKAVRLYERIYKMPVPVELKQFAGDKLADYYYSRGLYLTSGKYRNFTVESDSKNAVSSPLKTEKNKSFFLQFAVFSSRMNALKFIENQKSSKIDLKIIEKSGKFYVVNGPFGSHDEAEIFKRAIRGKNKNLKPFIKRFAGD